MGILVPGVEVPGIFFLFLPTYVLCMDIFLYSEINIVNLSISKIDD